MTRTNKNNIRDKTRAVFLAAIMALSMVAMSATLVGGAAAVSNSDTQVTDFQIADGEAPSERVVVSDTDLGNDGEFDDGVTASTDIDQTVEIEFDGIDGDDTGTYDELVAIDVSESVDLADEDDNFEFDFDGTDDESGLNVVRHTFEDGELLLDIEFTDTGSASVDVIFEINAEDHNLPDQTVRHHIESNDDEFDNDLVIEGSDETRYDIVQTGDVIFDADDTDTLEEGDDSPDIFGDDADTREIWEGQTVSIGAAEERDVVGIHEFEFNDEGEVVVGDVAEGVDQDGEARDLDSGTTPSNVTNIDTTGLEGGEYVVTVDDETRQSFAWLEVDELSLDLEVQETEVPENDFIEYEVSSDDRTGNDVTVALFDADDTDLEDVEDLTFEQVEANDDVEIVKQTTTELDSQGDAEVQFDTSEDDFGEEGDVFFGAVEHDDSSVNVYHDEENHVTIGEELEEDARLADRPYEQERGDIVEFTIDLDNTDVANVTVGDIDDQGYEADIDIEAENVGDEVTIAWNTWLAGGYDAGIADAEDIFWVVDDDDHELTEIDEESDIAGGLADRVLIDGTYDIETMPNPDGPEPEVSDASLITLNERSTGEMTTWTATGDNAEDAVEDNDPIQAIEDAQGDDLIVESEQIAERDVVISSFDSSGLQGLLVNMSDEDPADAYEEAEITEQFLNALNAEPEIGTPLDGAIDLTYTQQSPRPNRQPVEIDLGAQNTDDVAEYVSVVAGDDEYYIVLELDDFEAAESEINWNRDIQDGMDFETEFTLNPTLSQERSPDGTNEIGFGDYALVAPDEDEEFEEVTNDTWTAVDREVDVNVDNDELVVEPEAGQEIDGTSTVAPGTELRFNVRSTDAEGPFVIPGLRTTVAATETDADNEWALEDVDFSDAVSGDEFDLRFGGEFDEKDPIPGIVTDAEEPFFQVSDLEPEEGTVSQGDTVDVSATVENTGGQETTQDIELRLDGDELDSQEVTLIGGEDEEVVFEDLDTGALEPGEYEHSIASEDSEATGSLTVEGDEPNFDVDIDIDPDEVAPEDDVTITGTVENTGDAEGTQTVSITFDGDEEASEELTLGAGDEETITADITAPADAGDYDATVASDDDTATATLTVEDDAEANFDVDIDIDPDEVAPEDDVTITGTVENTGDAEGTQTVSITFDGDEEASEELTLGAGEDDTITADITAPADAGDYDADVESEDDSATATLTVEEDEEDDAEDDDADDDGAGFGVAAALIALLGAALLAYRRRAE